MLFFLGGHSCTNYTQINLNGSVMLFWLSYTLANVFICNKCDCLYNGDFIHYFLHVCIVYICLSQYDSNRMMCKMLVQCS